MARGGINKAVVQKARNGLLARGVHPSIDAVRIELGNTGSKTTIHRYLKELEGADQGRVTGQLALSEQLANLVNQLADQVNEEARAAVAGEREQLGRERIDYQLQVKQAESRIHYLEKLVLLDAERLQTAQHELQQAHEQRQQSEVENARLKQANRDLEDRLKERDAQIYSLEEKHSHARDTLEHYRQASKEQREQEKRQNQSQVQQLQLEVRQLQQTMIIKQDELTTLNRDNASLLTEIRKLQKDELNQRRLLDQKTNALEAMQSQLGVGEIVKLTLEQRIQDLKVDLDSLKKSKTRQDARRQPRNNESTTVAPRKRRVDRED